MGSGLIKLFHILPSLTMGGREKILLELIRRLDRKRFDITVCCLNEGGSLHESFKKEGVKIIFFSKRKGVDKKLFFRLGSFFKNQKPDIVHIHNPGALVYAAIGAVLGGVPVRINTEHGFAFREGSLLRIAESILRNFVDVNICVSASLRRQLAGFVISKRKIINIYNGIEIPSDNFHGPLDLRLKKEKFGFSGSDIIIGNVARLEKVKNHRFLIGSMRPVLEKYPHVKLLIVGDGNLKGELEDYTRSIGLTDNVLFWGEAHNVNELLQIMDVFVLSSTNEGISVTILEAMAHGKPVIATEVGGNSEIVIDGETGILVPSNDDASMSRAIISLLEDAERAMTMGYRGNQRVREAFDIKNMVNEIDKLYLTSLSRKTQNRDV